MIETTRQILRSLSSDDEHMAAEWAAYKNEDDNAAREALITHYSLIVQRTVHRLCATGKFDTVDRAELYQMGYVGLIEAIENFRPDLGVPFRYYCVRRINGSIVDSVGKISEFNEQITFRRKMRQQRLKSISGKISEAKSFEQKLEILGDVASDLLIGLLLEETGVYLGEDRDRSPSAYESLEWKQTLLLLNEELNALPVGERRVLGYHYREGLAFHVIAQIMGLSKSRISQVHKSGLARLRRRMQIKDDMSWQG